MTTWIYLALAIALEVGGALFMKQSQGFSKVLPSLLMFAFFAASIAALTMAAQRIGVGVSYAVWGGLATTLITLMGALFYGEPINLVKAFSITLIIIGVVVLNLNELKHE